MGFYYHNNNNNETMDDNMSHPLLNTLRLQSSQSKQRPLLHQPSSNSRSNSVLTSSCRSCSRRRSSTKCGNSTSRKNYNSQSVGATVVVMTATETSFKANHDDVPLMLRRRLVGTISRSVLLLLLLLLPGINILVVAFTTRTTTTTTTTTISTNAIITLPSFITETSQKYYHQRKSNVRSYRRCCFNVMVVRPQQSSDLQSTIVTTNNNNNIIDSSNGNVMIGTDPTTKPNYDTIIGPFGTFVDKLCLTLFRNQLRDEVLRSYSTMDDDENENDKKKKKNSRTKNTLRADPMYYETANYTQIVTLAAAMNARYPSGQQQKIQQSALNVLISLFPKWLPKWYRILFAQPFPIFSAKMNAYVTAALGVWLMGECTVNDIDIMTTTVTNTTTNTLLSSSSAAASLLPVGTNQGVLVTRCRFLEESQCASICIHSCKIPTQNFFWQQMGVPLLMEPNYTTGSCQFSFGRYPNTTTETTSIQTPCLSRCPTSGSYRSNHMVSRSSSNGSSTVLQNVHFDNATTTVKTSMCSMIEDVNLLT